MPLPQHEFERFGKSGQLISNQLPHIGSIADDICIIRSMTTNQINHDPAHTFFNTGTQISGRPSMGSWVLYGLGAETDNLPGFVVLTSVGGGQKPTPSPPANGTAGSSRAATRACNSTPKGIPYYTWATPRA